jgi:hypothetical protein
MSFLHVVVIIIIIIIIIIVIKVIIIITVVIANIKDVQEPRKTRTRKFVFNHKMAVVSVRLLLKYEDNHNCYWNIFLTVLSLACSHCTVQIAGRPARPRPTALLPPRSNGKPEAATAVVELLMMGMRMPETR